MVMKNHKHSKQINVFICTWSLAFLSLLQSVKILVNSKLTTNNCLNRYGLWPLLKTVEGAVCLKCEQRAVLHHSLKRDIFFCKDSQCRFNNKLARWKRIENSNSFPNSDPTTCNWCYHFFWTTTLLWNLYVQWWGWGREGDILDEVSKNWKNEDQQRT